MRSYKLYASVPMFFRTNDEIDWSTLEAYVENLRESGVDGIYSMAFNTRYMQMSFDELCAVNKHIIELLDGWSGDVIIGTPYLAYDRILDNYFDYLSINNLKPSAVSYLYPERFYDLDQLINWHLDKTKYGHPVCLHEMKLISGYDGSLIDWDNHALEQVLQHSGVWGVKEDSKNDDLTISTIEKFGDSKTVIVAGHGKRRVLELVKRLDDPFCWLNGSSMVAPKLGAMFAADLAGGGTEFCADYIAEFEIPFFRIVSAFGWHRASKVVIAEFMGVENFERSPLAFISNEELRRKFGAEVKSMRSFMELHG